MKATKEIDVLTASLEQTVKKVGELKQEREFAFKELRKLCERKECVEYKQDGL